MSLWFFSTAHTLSLSCIFELEQWEFDECPARPSFTSYSFILYRREGKYFSHFISCWQAINELLAKHARTRDENFGRIFVYDKKKNITAFVLFLRAQRILRLRNGLALREEEKKKKKKKVGERRPCTRAKKTKTIDRQARFGAVTKKKKPTVKRIIRSIKRNSSPEFDRVTHNNVV